MKVVDKVFMKDLRKISEIHNIRRNGFGNGKNGFGNAPATIFEANFHPRGYKRD